MGNSMAEMMMKKIGEQMGIDASKLGTPVRNGDNLEIKITEAQLLEIMATKGNGGLIVPKLHEGFILITVKMI
jgi:hypothetical protein